MEKNGRAGGRVAGLDGGEESPFFSLTQNLSQDIPGILLDNLDNEISATDTIKVHLLWQSKKVGRAGMNGSPLRFCECECVCARAPFTKDRRS